MGILIAGGDVGAGQAALGDGGTVRTAAGRDALGLQPVLLNGPDQEVHHEGNLVHHLLHAPVTGAPLQFDALVTVLLLQRLHALQHVALAFLKAVLIVVPDQGLQKAALRRRFEIIGVEVALPSLGVLAALVDGQHVHELHADLQGIDHDALGLAGMHAPAVDHQLGFRRVEGLVVVGSQAVAVDGVGHVRAKARQIQVMGAAAHFFVRRKGQLDGAVLDFRVLQQILGQHHFDGYGGLVVAAQKGGAVGHHQVVAHIFLHHRELSLFHHHAQFLVQHDVAALIVQDPGLHVLAGQVRRSIHVGDEAHGKPAASRQIGRDRRVDHAGPGVHVNVGGPDLLQFLFQLPGQVELLLRGGEMIHSRL